MPGPMGAEFIPFVPRPARMREDPAERSAEAECPPAAAAAAQYPPAAAAAAAQQRPELSVALDEPPLAESPPLVETPSLVEAPPAAHNDAKCLPDPPFGCALQAALDAQVRAAEVRCAAIRLACMAVGRVLRHALVLDPKLILRFVDEAIAAAQGQPGVVLVHPAHAGTLAAGGIGCRADERLADGDVAIELATGSVGATLEERAALAVQALADA